MRTHFSRLIDYIRASAALHQFQREEQTFGFALTRKEAIIDSQQHGKTIIATWDDYDNARIVLKATTSNQEMIPLTKRQKMLLDICKKHGTFTFRQIAPEITFLAKDKAYAALEKLEELGFLSSEIRQDEKTGRDSRHYIYKESEGFEIPTFEKIMELQEKATKETQATLETKETKETEATEDNNSSELPELPEYRLPLPLDSIKSPQKTPLSATDCMIVLQALAEEATPVDIEAFLSRFVPEERPRVEEIVTLWRTNGDVLEPRPGFIMPMV